MLNQLSLFLSFINMGLHTSVSQFYRQLQSISTYIDDFSNSVVSIGILYKFDCIFSNPIHQSLNFFFIGNALNQFLNYTQTIGVHCQINEVIIHFIKDKSSLGLFKTREHLLYYMCSLGIQGERDNVSNECISDKVFFFRQVHQIKHGLDCVCSLFIATYLNELWFDHPQDSKSLITRTT